MVLEGTALSDLLTLLIADQRALMRDGLRALLQDEFAIVAEAADGRQVIAEARRTRPQVILMDTDLPQMNGIDAARVLRPEMPSTRILMLTDNVDERTVGQALQAGVNGYVLKDVEAADLRRQIRAVARGESVLDSRVTGLVMARLRGDGALAAGHEPVLTAQQMTILRLMAQGLSNKAIAEQIHLSENTVKSYTSDILHRLDVKNRVEAAQVAFRRGWI